MKKSINKFHVVTAVLFLLSACAEKPPLPPERLTLKAVSFADLPGWTKDHQNEAVPAFMRSCAVFQNKPDDAALSAPVGGKIKDWKPVCDKLKQTKPSSGEEARAFFEQEFRPYAVTAPGKSDGLFTGYYEAEISGGWQPNGPYQTPLWARPDDLITVDLGDFKTGLKGQKIAGKVENRKLRPYDNRAAIAQGSLQRRAQPLLWTDDPVAAFFLEIQGSGRVRLPGGSTVRVGYDAQNGHSYVAIGRVLADEGVLEKPVTMAKIRDWLRKNPGRAQEVMNRNPSVVFFRLVEGEGPIGAQGVVLTPRRSLAVDLSFVPLGVPIWLDTEEDNGVPAIRRLVVAQDTGGAIKGPVRGDFFWGAGAEEEEKAGAMQSRGAYYLLLPKDAGPHE